MATAASNTNRRTATGGDESSRAQARSWDEPLDTTVRLVTPERIVFQYPLAGPFRRFGAFLIDLALLIVLMVTAALLAGLLTLGSGAGLGLMFVAYFVLNWGYGASCEGLFNGQTPGKRVVGIRVISDRGVPINGAQAALRNLVGMVDGFFPFCFLLGLSSMILTRKFQRLGDLAAGTMVVVEERRHRVRLERIAGPEVEAILPSLPLRVSAGPEMARALSDYVRFRGRVPAVRREEIAAALAGPLRRRYGLPGETSNDAVLCAVYHRVFLGE